MLRHLSLASSFTPRAVLSPLLLLLVSLLSLCPLDTHAQATCVGATISLPTLFTAPVLDGSSIPRYVSSLPNPLASTFVPDPTVTASDFYRLSMRQITQQILPPGCPSTTVWAYGYTSDPLNNPQSYSYPARTIVALRGRRVQVQWTHTQLPTQHILPIDRTMHCGHNTVNCTPDVRTVVHLHGGHLASAYDGFPDAWRSAEGVNGPMYANQPYIYDNDQEPALLWYHDHSPGTTRLNVYAGLAGFYLIRGAREAEWQALNQLPRFPYDVPILIQDRFFFPNGSLAYPDMPFEGFGRIMNSVFGNVFVVNGLTWPRMSVEPRRYRLRLLNGCNSRFLTLRFVSRSTSSPTTLSIVVIGTDGGLRNAPLDVSGQPLVLAPAERVDLIVNFAAAQPGEEFVVTNSAATPYPYGTSVPAGDPMGQVMLFQVNKPLVAAVPLARAPPTSLRSASSQLRIPANISGLTTRRLVLFDRVDSQYNRLRRVMGTDELGPLNFCDPITENPALGATEVWEIYNPTGETHPMHVHLSMFQIIDRRSIIMPPPGATSGYRLGAIVYPVQPYELGLKDTVRVDPNQVVRIIVTFDKPGLFVWHCHILEHEDHMMMRGICVGGNCPTNWLGC